MIVQRNPSLDRLSAQCFFITYVKKDPNINTVSMSVMTLKGPNADFDGDELNMLLILDQYFYGGLCRLAPHHGVHDLQVPDKIARLNGLPGPVVSTIAHWLQEAPQACK